MSEQFFEKKPFETPLWHAMRATYRRELDAANRLEQENIGCFIPMQYKLRVRHGRKERVLQPVVRNLLFVHAAPSELQHVKQSLPYLQYITDTRNHQKIIVPDDQMRNFILVAGSNDERLIYLKPQELNLSRGQRVRIRGGVFDGVEGLFLKVKGARSKRIVVRLENFMAVAAEVQPEFVEVIE